MSNYYYVLEVIENYDDEEIIDDFKSKFKEGENISEDEFKMFCKNYIDDMSEMNEINKNWNYIKNNN